MKCKFQLTLTDLLADVHVLQQIGHSRPSLRLLAPTEGDTGLSIIRTQTHILNRQKFRGHMTLATPPLSKCIYVVTRITTL